MQYETVVMYVSEEVNCCPMISVSLAVVRIPDQEEEMQAAEIQTLAAEEEGERLRPESMSRAVCVFSFSSCSFLCLGCHPLGLAWPRHSWAITNTMSFFIFLIFAPLVFIIHFLY